MRISDWSSDVCSSDLLARHGIPVPAGHRVKDADDAADAARELGFPVALKALGLAHKTEAGAVRLGLSTPEAVRAAAGEMAGIGKGLYVERQVTAPRSEERRVGKEGDRQRKSRGATWTKKKK